MYSQFYINGIRTDFEEVSVSRPYLLWSIKVCQNCFTKLRVSWNKSLKFCLANHYRIIHYMPTWIESLMQYKSRWNWMLIWFSHHLGLRPMKARWAPRPRPHGNMASSHHKPRLLFFLDILFRRDSTPALWYQFTVRVRVWLNGENRVEKFVDV